jgi:hypothetical protein
LLCHV